MQEETVTGLTVVEVDGEYCIDSRLIAGKLDIEHEVFIRTIHKYQAKMEKLGLLRFRNGSVRTLGSRGTKHIKYAMLNEDQCIFASTLSRNSDEVVDFKLALTIAFREVRDRLADNKQQQKPKSLSPLADRLAATVEQVEEEIPDQHFAMATEMHREVRHAELLGLLDHDATAFPEISVGRTWASYARSTFGVITKNLPKYKHNGPGLKCEVYPRCYPIELLGKFRVWFRTIYLPEHCPIYVGNRKKRLERQVAGTETSQQIKGENL